LQACVRLKLLEILRPGPLSSAALAQALDLPMDSTERLLGAAAALDLVSRAGPQRWALGPQGAALLGNPGLADMIAHHRGLYADLAQEVDLPRWWPGRTGGLLALRNVGGARRD
jgi:demethylspheroidene O-methyltransferase